MTANVDDLTTIPEAELLAMSNQIDQEIEALRNERRSIAREIQRRAEVSQREARLAHLSEEDIAFLRASA